VLSESGVAQSSGDIARQAQLVSAGVRRALHELVGAGIVRSLGTGPRKLNQLDWAHPLAGPLTALFDAERARVDGVFTAIREIVSDFRPAPLAVWVEGPVAVERDGLGDPIIVGVLAESGTLPYTTRALQTALASVETVHDVTIEVLHRTPEELEATTAEERAALGRSIVLLGSPPSTFPPLGATRPVPRPAASQPYDHQEAQAFALAAAISEKLRDDPTTIRRARRHVARRLETASPTEAVELEEWDHILRTMPVARLRRFLVDQGPRATRLRQNLPFVDVLTPHEREAALS
jgi:hypothetical protein